ncbi:MAG: metallophosphoesterase family protein [Paraclostridium sp.]
MKIGVVSDTHRMNRFIDKTIPYLKECDLIIHAGDNVIDSKYIHKMTNVGVMAVRGNCDFENIESELLFDVEEKNIFVCHGDIYGVKYGMHELEKKAREKQADIVVFGHTHTPYIKEKDGILYINPGSTSLPRGVDYRSFMVVNILEGNIGIEEIRI